MKSESFNHHFKKLQEYFTKILFVGKENNFIKQFFSSA